jgi:IS1 family transposase
LERLSEQYGDYWVWLSFDPVHKIVPAFVAGKISQEHADLLLQKTKEVNDGSLHVFFSDQRPHYKEAILKSFGHWVQPERQGSRGPWPRPRLEPPPDLLYAQVVKHRRKGRVDKVTGKIVFGTAQMLQDYLDRSSVSQHLNTAFIERQNGTMRHQNRRFTRKTWGFSRKDEWMVRQLYLSLGYYHFCWAHGGLREEIKPPLPTKGSGSPKKWREVTPMMSIGVTDHKWTLEELLTFRVPPTTDSTVKGH